MLFLLERRRWKARQQAMMDTLNPLQRNALVQYMNKTTGWSLVGFGGFLIATKESWELHEMYAWPTWVFVVLVMAAGILCLSFAVIWLERKDRMA